MRSLYAATVGIGLFLAAAPAADAQTRGGVVCQLLGQPGLGVIDCAPPDVRVPDQCSQVTVGGDSYAGRIRIPNQTNGTANLVTLSDLGGSSQSDLVNLNFQPSGGPDGLKAGAVRNHTNGTVDPEGSCASSGSASRIENLELVLGPLTIRADTLEASADAGGCCVTNHTASVSTRIVRLEIAGPFPTILIDDAGLGIAPNTIIQIPPTDVGPILTGSIGKIVLREEIVSSGGAAPDFNTSEAEANAIHVTLTTGEEAIVSHASARIFCCCTRTPPVDGCCFDDQGMCSDQTDQDACAGTFVAGAQCGSRECSAAVDGCCFDTDTCTDQTDQDTCSGTFVPGAACGDAECAPPPQPGCCFDAGVCADQTDQDSCDGTFVPGAQCGDAECAPPPQPGCCFDGRGTCSDQTDQDSCSGTFVADAECGDAACAPVGCCVLTDSNGAPMCMPDCNACFAAGRGCKPGGECRPGHADCFGAP